MWWLKQSQEIEKEESNPGPKMDLSLKAGQTITINLKSKTPAAGGGERKDNPRPRPAAGSFTGILPPPPGAKPTGKQDLGPLFRAGGTPMPANVPAPSPINQLQQPRTGNLIDDDWGAFSSYVTDRQTNKPTDRQTNKPTHRQTNKPTNRSLTDKLRYTILIFVVTPHLTISLAHRSGGSSKVVLHSADQTSGKTIDGTFRLDCSQSIGVTLFCGQSIGLTRMQRDNFWLTVLEKTMLMVPALPADESAGRSVGREGRIGGLNILRADGIGMSSRRHVGHLPLLFTLSTDDRQRGHLTPLLTAGQIRRVHCELFLLVSLGLGAGGTPMPANVPAPSPINQLQQPRTGNLIDDDWGAFSSYVTDRQTNRPTDRHTNKPTDRSLTDKLRSEGTSANTDQTCGKTIDGTFRQDCCQSIGVTLFCGQSIGLTMSVLFYG
eukprot:sb/3464841/